MENIKEDNQNYTKKKTNTKLIFYFSFGFKLTFVGCAII